MQAVIDMDRVQLQWQRLPQAGAGMQQHMRIEPAAIGDPHPPRQRPACELALQDLDRKAGPLSL
jgi:hypothetical protein